MSKLKILQSYLACRWTNFRSRRALEAYQHKAALRLLQQTLPRSAYTRSRLGDLPLARWAEMVPMNKQDMMENFDTLNTVGMSKEQALKLAKQDELTRDFTARIAGISLGLSSGTSGKLGMFALSDSEQQVWAGRVLAKTLPYPLLWPRRDRIAFFLRANNSMYETVGSLRLQFCYFDLFKPLEQHIDDLLALRPTILVAPPSVIRQLIQRIPEKIKKLPLAKVICVAEPLDPIDERFFRQTFGQCVHQIYQATEGFLATTCKFGTLHLNEDMLVIHREPIDENRFVPIVTDLFRHVQPVIRYRLDDVLHVRPVPCSCGSVHTPLWAVEGRQDDVLFLSQNNNTLRPVFADFLRRRILMSCDDLSDYGVRQIDETRLELFVESDDKASRQRVIDGLNDLFRSFDCRLPKYSFVPEWPRGGMAKRKRIIRDWTPPADVFTQSDL